MKKRLGLLLQKKLRNYIVRISSGATPSVKEEEKFYSDKENGIPFLRVQNLQTNGKISLNEVKYINKETHDNYLRRSQVSGGDLLVKITGVGRMAIASVAPDDFVGNTNQHMVIIKTQNKETSEYLANYFNLDIVEKLASRRATGGTRPALDYSALKSIPVVEGIDFTLIKEAERLKQQKENEAKTLLATIDDYLFDELKIELPKKDNSLKSRIFTTQFSEITSVRFDPFFQKTKNDKIESVKFDNITLRTIAQIEKGQSITKEKIVSGKYPVIAGGQTSPYSHNEYNSEGNCITVSASGAYAGYVWYHTNSIFASDCIVIRSINEKEVLTTYIYELLRLKQSEIYLMQQGAGQPHVYPVDLAKIKIPIVSIENQSNIVRYIQNIRLQAKLLQQEANDILEQAKKQTEEKILRETK
ncbi:restriction endonuclease subunit S [Parabacteroides faecis]|uniref:restriction endonuclease subunit S n=1 Tax=Parabacteroides faecis TaxID=1217282 RepID=UPI00216679F5|nr:restriction endonuclease subunit S [Parabacteroides faecis]MCS2893508.1 restriction endonuclease subunit S [Parabacteroides faecis]